MKCPHCITAFHSNPSYGELNNIYALTWEFCPACNNPIIFLERSNESILLYPKKVSRSPLPPEVPESYSNDYNEACLTLEDSPKASATLSRRCLQNLLREKAKVKEDNLVKEIQQIIDEAKLPPQILTSIDAVRIIGNFAAHPIKSDKTSEIIEVEAGEAEWTLNVLESLFDYFFVQPALIQKKKDALNQKLKDAGKPELK